jgi:hypothetical protein
MQSNIILLALAALSTSTLHAEVKPNTLFSDGAVLQRGQKIPVWGTARDGEKVSSRDRKRPPPQPMASGACILIL